MKKPKIEEFLNNHNIPFKNIGLYKRAITHTTYSNEHRNIESYEMLELLGDSIIQSKSTIIIFNHFKRIGAGEATQIRSKNVDNIALANLTKHLGLNKYLLCSNNRDELINKTKICADLFESFIGALFLDLGDAEVDKFLSKYLAPKIKLTDINNLKDYKTKFQELIQSTSTSEIYYESSKLPDNNFSTKLIHDKKCYGEGVGKTKKLAENNAAKNALEKLGK
ncbi:MAG: ribonuclease III [Metamycoplasmataceae bacterium]